MSNNNRSQQPQDSLGSNQKNQNTPQKQGNQKNEHASHGPNRMDEDEDLQAPRKGNGTSQNEKSGNRNNTGKGSL